MFSGHYVQLYSFSLFSQTRINIEGGAGRGQHRFDGRIEHDIFRSRGGTVIKGYGEGSHSRNPIDGLQRRGEIGVGVRFPFGGRRRH